MTPTIQHLLERAEVEIRAAGLPDDWWALDRQVEDRPSLLLTEEGWTAGFTERGKFSVEFVEPDFDIAIARFISWVRRGMKSTEESAAATRRYLEREGKQGP